MSARVLITGSNGGIGTATRRALAARGARVVGLDLQVDESDPDQIACDVTDQESVDRAVEAAVERLGGLDVVINNAGLGTPQSAGERPDAAALAVLDVNLLGTWRVSAAALPALRRSHGRVVNVASGLAHITVPFAVAYCASKRGVVAYSDALRLEFGTEIDVTTVYPGYIRTAIHDASADAGVGLDGAVPEEPLSAAADTLVRAALDRPARDLATTRRGTISYAIADRVPRRIVQRVAESQLRRMASKGHFSRPGLGRELGERLSR